MLRKITLSITDSSGSVLFDPFLPIPYSLFFFSEEWLGSFCKSHEQK